ncbi:hypothetical protein FRC01_003006 [Tulasnella sp. 417]|nr:hypothetical protein FRC01_003006 [Tulasnella sp. 417]
MGQSHSQPSSVRQHDQANAIASPQRELSAADTPSPQRDTAAPVPRRRTPSSGAPRKRLSTLIRGKRPASTVEPSFNERGEPLNAVDRGISVPPLSVKSSLRRLFNRRSWAPSGQHGSRDPSTASPYGEADRQPEASHSSMTANSSRDASFGVGPETSLSQSDAAGALSSTGVRPTMEGGSFSSQPNTFQSSPSTTEQVSSSTSPSNTLPVLPEGNNHTARRAPTKREIAMLSGTSSPDSGNTPTRGLSTSSDPPSTPSATVASTEPSSDPASDAPVSPVLEEDPAALGLSRHASWHSFTHEDSHEADLATLDAISVAEVGEENKHATSDDPILMPEESPLDMDLRSDIGEASHPPTNVEGTSDVAADSTTNAPTSNAHARLPGTFGDEAEAARRSSQDAENPSGAAELLGALLLAAASATANMLMSDPPGSSNAGSTTPATAEQTSPDATLPAEEPRPSLAETVGSRLRPRSSVGVGPRPRPRTMHVADGDHVPDYIGRSRDRPRSLIGSLRDRVFGAGAEEEALGRLLRSLPGSSSSSSYDRGHRRSRSERLGPYPMEDTPTPPPEDPARDPIDSLRERIASELMRALANRDPQAEDPSSPISSRPSEPRTVPNEQTSSPGSQGGMTSLPLSLPSPSTATAGSGDQPPEGSFERFLQDANAELRRTLQERMNYREAATAAPIAVPIAPAEGSPAETSPTPAPEADESPEETPADSTSDTPATPAGTRLVHRAPEGVIEPRLNWWRMHRFPARTVAAIPSPDAPAPTPSPAEPTATPQNNAEASPSPPATPAPQASTILIPVIVVGIRTAPTTLVQEIGALAAPPPPPMIPEAAATDFGRPSSIHRNGSGSSMTIRSPQDRNPSRLPWSRALEVTRALAARRRMERERSQRSREPSLAGPSAGPTSMPSGPTLDTPPAASTDGDASARDRTRNYLIWVIGGYYPESHPILTSPNLLLNQFDQDDFWGLAELLGQVKPPVASKDDIEQSGLEIIKASQVTEYEKEGKITSNTSERCLICLSDYEPDEDIRVMACKHAFHQPCVDKWLEVGRNNCPACRSKGVEVQETPSPPAETSGQTGEASSSAV